MARDTSKLVTIPGELHSAATGNIVAAAEEVFDYTTNKYQKDINQEVAYIKEDSSVDPIPSFNPQSQTVHVDEQVLSNAQKKQVRKNIGFGNGDIDSTPTSGSDNVVRSGGVYSSMQELRSTVNPQVGYYTCSTAGDTAAKVIDASGYTLLKGGGLRVNFTEKNTVANATLNIEQTGAKPLYYNGVRVSTNNSWYAGEIMTLFYDGAAFQLNSLPDLDEYDVSARNGGQAFTFEEAVALVPEAYRHGGLKLRFISNSDSSTQSSDNKYVQYRLIADEWSTNVTDWQGVDNEPTPASRNLAESGGVAETTILPVITHPQTYVNEYGVVNSTKSPAHMSTEFVLAKEGIVISGIQRYTDEEHNIKICFYDKYRNFISSISGEDNDDIELTSENIPSNAVYFIANLNITNGVIYSKHRVFYQDYIEKSVNPYVSIIQNKILNKYGNVVDTQFNSFAVSDYYYVVSGIFIKNCHPAEPYYIYLCFYDKNKNFISSLASDSTTQINHIIADNEIPQDAMYFRVTVNPETYSIIVPQNKVFSKMLDCIDSFKTDIELEQGYNFIDKNGQIISTTITSFLVTKPIIPKAGMVLDKVHPVQDQEMAVAAFYDVNNLCIGLLVSDGANPYSHILQDSDIPNGCVYMRVTIYPLSSRISNFEYYTKVEITKEISDRLYEKMSFPIKNSSSNCYLSADGKVKPTTVNSFFVSDFCPVKENIAVVYPHASSSAANTFICFYDKNLKFISNITTTDTNLSSFALTASNIPTNAAYFRATVWDYGYVNYRVPISDIPTIKKTSIISNFGYFDYSNALSMNRSDLIEVIEAASNGRCTALYDDDGYPSLMYRIPKVAIGALAPTLGDLNTVHPAFIVGGVEKDYMYVSVFETSLYEGHYVSWFGLKPVGSITIHNLRTGISNKGDGWHLETIYERSLIVLLTNLLNSPTPTGNTANGMSHVKPWEYCQREGGYLPGISSEKVLGHTGLPYINGTQPSAWSHNKEQWGIQDVIGGFHRICDLYKLINGKIYISADNKFFKKGDDLSGFEDSWFDTGAAFDFIDDNIVLNTSVTNKMTVPYYVQRNYSDIRCTSDYDALNLDLRKKLALLLLCSRVSSSDVDPVFGLIGRFGIANHKPLCYGVFGGAQEYPGIITTSDANISGLGTQITAYPIDDNATEGHNAHYNMGSRMVYIP